MAFTPDYAISHYLLASFINLLSCNTVFFIACKATNITGYMHRSPTVKGHLHNSLNQSTVKTGSIILCVQVWFCKIDSRLLSGLNIPSFPDLSDFVLKFAFSKIDGSRRKVKKGEGLGKYMRNKHLSKFLTSKVEKSRSCEHLRFCLATEYSMMKSSMLFER